MGKDLSIELKGKMDADGGIALMEQMLTFPPNKRVTCKRMLCDPWFDEVREEMIEQFGNVYPHCGSKEYQLQKFKQRQEAEDAENMDPNEEEDTDYDEADDDDDF